MDPLSNVLGVVAARSVVSGTLYAGGRWAVRFPPANGIKFWGIVRGTARMKSGREAAITLGAGDVVLRTAASVAVMGSDLTESPTELAALLQERKGAHVGAGDAFAMVGGEVLLADDDVAWFRATLPPTIVISTSSPRAATLQWLMTEVCAMSRAAFAEHFKQVAGTTPLAYLTAWRIRLARRGLPCLSGAGS